MYKTTKTNTHHDPMTFTIVDSDFEEQVDNWLTNRIIDAEHHFRSYWDKLVGVYEVRRLNVASNVVLAIKERATFGGADNRDLFQYLDRICQSSHKVSEYREEIETLLLLV